MASLILRAVARRSAKCARGLLPIAPKSFSSDAVVAAEERFLKYSSPVPVTLDLSDVVAETPTRVTTLPNGLRVASQNIPLAESATVGVWISAGSRFEATETYGTAHFLEHIIFKGTSKRTTKGLTYEIENIGGHLNAYTSREQTTYFSTVLKQDLPLAVDVISDILQNSNLDQAAIDDERSTILKEMKEVEKQDHEMLFDHLHATAFQHTALGRTILGTAENVKSVQKSDLENYIKTHYTGPRMVLSAAGQVDHDELVALAQKKFGGLSSDPTSPADLIAKSPAHFTGSEIRIRDDDLPLTQFIIAFEGASWTDPDAIPLMVIHQMLGGWSKGDGLHNGSELAQSVAANNLAENFSAFNTHYTDTGLFGVSATAHPDSLEDLSWSIMHEITRTVYRVSDDDVTRAKNLLKSSLLLQREISVSSTAEDIGRQLLTYGRRIPLAEVFARIDAVDADTIKRVAERFFYDKDFALVALGPTQFLPDYNWFRRHTFWLRY